MKFSVKRNGRDNDDCVCDLTKFLDSVCSCIDLTYKSYCHYIVCDKASRADRVLLLRVPGRTVGAIHLDSSSDTISYIEILNTYKLSDYPSNIDEQLSKYIGATLEFVE